MDRASRTLIAFSVVVGFTSCTTLTPRSPASKGLSASKTNEAEPRVVVIKTPRKPTPDPMVEAFRCSMQAGSQLHLGLRVYSSLDGKENSVLYGPERLDLPPNPYDHQLYVGVSAVVAGANDGTHVTFKHPRIAIQIAVNHNADASTPLEAVFTDEGSGARQIKGYCTLVSKVAYFALK